MQGWQFMPVMPALRGWDRRITCSNLAIEQSYVSAKSYTGHSHAYITHAYIHLVSVFHICIYTYYTCVFTTVACYGHGATGFKYFHNSFKSHKIALKYKLLQVASDEETGVQTVKQWLMLINCWAKFWSRQNIPQGSATNPCATTANVLTIKPFPERKLCGSLEIQAEILCLLAFWDSIVWA